MKFRVLGPTEIYDEINQRKLPIGSQKQRTLVGALVVRHGFTISADQLSEEIWGNFKPKRSANALQAQIYRLRQTLGHLSAGGNATREFLITEEAGYVLKADPEQIDSEVFMRTVDRARNAAAQDPAIAEKLLRSALKLWRGPALQGSRGPLCAAGAIQLDEARLGAMELLYDVSLRLNLHTNIVTELEALTNSYPLRERFYDQLMVALYRSGHQAQALSVYERVRRRLANELGVAPVPALRMRMQQILAHSPELLATPPAEGPRTVPRVSSAVPAAPPAPRTILSPPPPRESSVDSELRSLRHQVRELVSEQQTLISTVQHLSSKLEGVIRKSPEPSSREASL